MQKLNNLLSGKHTKRHDEKERCKEGLPHLVFYLVFISTSAFSSSKKIQSQHFPYKCAQCWAGGAHQTINTS